MTDKVRQELKLFDQAIKEKLGFYRDDHTPDYFDLQVIENELQEDGDVTPQFDPMEEGIEDIEPEILEQNLAAQVWLPLEDNLVHGKVIA
jgi:hypothetical protein